MEAPTNATWASSLPSTTPPSEAGNMNLLWDDATWVLSCTFLIFTMQSGFGLLESGSVSRKNEANIMVKNAVDVIFGGLSYWAVGYGLSFGKGGYENFFCGYGSFFVDLSQKEVVGSVYSKFFFHASFATTATTIVSGAMAERTKLEAYMAFSFLNTFTYCFPSHWVWDSDGWLYKLGVFDIAGVGVVHLVGGTTGLVATIMLKPRHGRFQKGGVQHTLGSSTNAMLGMFMLWWGWLGFNCGSTYGITGGKWILAARSAVTTIMSSIGGGVVGIFLSYVMNDRVLDIGFLINGVLSSLVSVTGICALASSWEALVIGVIGGLLGCLGSRLVAKLKIDDPVDVIPVHFISAIWGMLAVGLFVNDGNGEDHFMPVSRGLFLGGGWYLLGVQTLALVCICAWTATSSFVILKLIDVTIGLRVPLHEELLGADIVEHGLHGRYSRKTKTLITPTGQRIPIKTFPAGEVNLKECKTFSRRKSAEGFVGDGSTNLGFEVSENRLDDSPGKRVGLGNNLSILTHKNETGLSGFNAFNTNTSVTAAEGGKSDTRRVFEDAPAGIETPVLDIRSLVEASRDAETMLRRQEFSALGIDCESEENNEDNVIWV